MGLGRSTVTIWSDYFTGFITFTSPVEFNDWFQCFMGLMTEPKSLALNQIAH